MGDYEKIAIDRGLEIVELKRCLKSAESRALAAERDLEEGVEAFVALLEDRPTKDGRWPHLAYCNFSHKRIGDGNCNCPLGKRIEEARGLLREAREERGPDGMVGNLDLSARIDAFLGGGKEPPRE